MSRSMQPFIEAVVGQVARPLGVESTLDERGVREREVAARVRGLLRDARAGGVVMAGAAERLHGDAVLLSAFFVNIDLLYQHGDPHADAVALLVMQALERLGVEADAPFHSPTFQTGAAMLTEDAARIITRDLQTLRREVEAYPTDADLWLTAPGIANPAGTLVLHLLGNLQHYIGARLGGSGYRRDRDAEFSRRDVPRAALLAELDRTADIVRDTLSRLPAAELATAYPEPMGGAEVGKGMALVHLISHLGYHLGQVNYHRRLLAGRQVPDEPGAGALRPGEGGQVAPASSPSPKARGSDYAAGRPEREELA